MPNLAARLSHLLRVAIGTPSQTFLIYVYLCHSVKDTVPCIAKHYCSDLYCGVLYRAQFCAATHSVAINCLAAALGPFPVLCSVKGNV